MELIKLMIQEIPITVDNSKALKKTISIRFKHDFLNQYKPVGFMWSEDSVY